MSRATIEDVAKSANVSVATVNRVLHKPEKVREATAHAVIAAAETLGFYGIRSMRERVAATRPAVRIGVVLLQRTRTYYRELAAALSAAAIAASTHDVRIAIEHLDDLAPQSAAEAMLRLAENVDVLGVVAVEHPIVAAAIETVAQKGVRVFALISQLTANRPLGYVGADAWKVGRMAAWAFDHMCPQPGKIATLVGSHRFRCQESNEMGFRSYFREHTRGFELLEAVATFESTVIAREVTEDLLARHSDLRGLFISGGGRRAPSRR